MDKEKSIPTFNRNEFKAWLWSIYKDNDMFHYAHVNNGLDICKKCDDEFIQEATGIMKQWNVWDPELYFKSDINRSNVSRFYDRVIERDLNTHLFDVTPDDITEMEAFLKQTQEFKEKNEPKKSLKGIDDGGERITYGERMAMREPADGKGRFDLITPFGLMRLARWYELGGHKYAPRNWEKGIPFSRYLDSAMRHLNKFLMGMDDEDHLSAAAWNIFAIIHHQELGQWELDDLPHYKGLGYGAGPTLPEGFEEYWKKHLEKLEAECDEANKKAKAAMEARIEDLKARFEAIEQGEDCKNQLIHMIEDAVFKPSPNDKPIYPGGC